MKTRLETRATPVASLALIALFAAGTPVAAQSPEAIWHEVDLDEGIFAVVTADEVNPSSYANSIVVSGTEGTLVVDTQDRPAAAERIIAAIRRRGLPPVRWVVNTHWHSDHTIGNEAFARAFPDAEFLAHPATADSLRSGGERGIAESQQRLQGVVDRIEEALEAGDVPEEDVDRYREAAEERRARIRELDGVGVVVPEGRVDPEERIDLGGRTVHLVHPGEAHTKGDVVVWVPDVRFLAAGDLLEEAPLWLDGADVAGWSRALDRLGALDPVRVLPSHGRVRDDAALLDAHRRVLARAVRVAGMQGFGGEAEITAEFTDLEHLLEPYGVGVSGFRAYVVTAVGMLRGS